MFRVSEVEEFAECDGSQYLSWSGSSNPFQFTSFSIILTGLRMTIV